ncbi:hypothetical protein [Streptomyces aureoversilis]|uniref:Uncharacterized protein n=1 Tax=Streptomyces aureoversilis TaxID=67277 RepID=A0ABV9ZVY5_9ACTN
MLLRNDLITRDGEWWPHQGGWAYTIDALFGPWVTFAGGAGFILVHYAGPVVAHELAVRRFARRLRRR